MGIDGAGYDVPTPTPNDAAFFGFLTLQATLKKSLNAKTPRRKNNHVTIRRSGMRTRLVCVGQHWPYATRTPASGGTKTYRKAATLCHFFYVWRARQEPELAIQ
jgi:hypothetical protein